MLNINFNSAIVYIHLTGMKGFKKMNVNLVRVPKEYKDKKGVVRKSYDFYVVSESGEAVAIVAKWNKNQDGSYNPTDSIRLRLMSSVKEAV